MIAIVLILVISFKSHIMIFLPIFAAFSLIEIVWLMVRKSRGRPIKRKIVILLQFGLHPYDWTGRVRRVWQVTPLFPLFSWLRNSSSKSSGER
jgi:hypothetical protein